VTELSLNCDVHQLGQGNSLGTSTGQAHTFTTKWIYWVSSFDRLLSTKPKVTMLSPCDLPPSNTLNTPPPPPPPLDGQAASRFFFYL
jgi:hypothetical protein